MAEYKISWKKSALKELKRLPDDYLRKALKEIESLKTEPFPVNSRKLKGSDYTYRLRFGRYRLIYEIRHAEIIICILKISHRKDVYK